MEKIFKHKHIVIASHSPKQQAMFFALVNSLALNLEEVKERAKSRFKISCFNELTSSNMNFLIERLLEKQSKDQKPPATDSPNLSQRGIHRRQGT